MVFEEPGYAALAGKTAFDGRPAGHVAPFDFADFAIGPRRRQQLIERYRFLRPFLLDGLAVLHELRRGSAAHAEIHERKDRLLVDRFLKVEARSAVPRLEQLVEAARSSGRVASAFGQSSDRKQLVGRKSVGIAALRTLRQDHERFRLCRRQRRVSALAGLQDRRAHEVGSGENAFNLVADLRSRRPMSQVEHNAAGQDFRPIERAGQR